VTSPEEVREVIAASTPQTALPCARPAIEDGLLGSLAGLFDTYLGVSGFDDLLDRIRWAWASLWNARALAALSSMGLSPLRASQAVIVQEMIETRSAGVLFSRDPSGRPDTLLINATWGLGEAISQGELAGDLFWVRRSTGELIACETARSAHRIELAPQGMGTVEVPLADEQRGRPHGRAAERLPAPEDGPGAQTSVRPGPPGGPVVFQLRRNVARRPEEGQRRSAATGPVAARTVPRPARG
jgi:pyruvate,water dikinase